MLLTRSSADVGSAKVFLDGRKNRELGRRLETYLRQQCNDEERQVIADFRFAPKGNALIQLADMVVGALARSYYADKRNAATYRAILEPRLCDVWEFGRRT